MFQTADVVSWSPFSRKETLFPKGLAASVKVAMTWPSTVRRIDVACGQDTAGYVRFARLSAANAEFGFANASSSEKRLAFCAKSTTAFSVSRSRAESFRARELHLSFKNRTACNVVPTPTVQATKE